MKTDKQNVIILLIAIVIILQVFTLIKQNCSVEKQDVKLNQSSPDPSFQENNPKDTMNPYKNSKITSQINPNEDKTWGYDILIEGKAIIHQPNIPGMAGNSGFKNKEAANKVAELIISKIKKNKMPPTINLQELDSLKVLR